MTVSSYSDIEIDLDPQEAWDTMVEFEKKDMREIVLDEFPVTFDELCADENISDLVYTLDDEKAKNLLSG